EDALLPRFFDRVGEVGDLLPVRRPTGCAVSLPLSCPLPRIPTVDIAQPDLAPRQLFPSLRLAQDIGNGLPIRRHLRVTSSSEVVNDRFRRQRAGHCVSFAYGRFPLAAVYRDAIG